MISNSLALLLAAGSMCFGGAQSANKSQAMIVIEATYPGANAHVVADTVAAPIEQRVNGIENLVRMVSRSSNDGKYLLAVTFKQGVDLDNAQVLVQNRVALAQPMLPELVTRMGITVKKKAPIRFLVALTSPRGQI